MARVENIGGFVTRVIIVVCCLICLQKPTESSPISSKLVAGGVDWLTRYGYLVPNDPRTGNLRTQQDLKKAIKLLQRFAGLPETGQLDQATLNQMTKSRCGVADFGKTDNMRRKKRYTLQETYWKKKDLTYKIKSFTSDIRDQEKQRQIFKKSFDLWSKATNLRIKEDRYSADKDVDIHISFENGYHNDAYPFDGQGGTLAHAFYPHNNLGLSGDAHFDDDERFTTGTSDGVNLDWVAVHEFGHSLGLEHSKVRESIMFPWYKGYKANIQLTNDDILGIQGLYGKPPQPQPTDSSVSTKPASTKPPIPVENDVCSISSYDTFFVAPDGKTYALKGTQFWIISSGSSVGLESGPHKVSDLWKELPSKIDAVYKKSSNSLVFFSGSRFWQYYYNSRRKQYRIEYDADSIARFDSGLPMDLANMDAAFIWERNGRTYFFKGDKYWRSYEGKIDFGYPKSISVWKGLPEKIDAAMKWRNGKSYFFTGPKYYRFDDFNIQVEAGYPKSIALKWMRCEKDNMDVPTPTEAAVDSGDKQNATQGCACTQTCSSNSAIFQPSLLTLFSLLVFAKLNF